MRRFQRNPCSHQRQWTTHRDRSTTAFGKSLLLKRTAMRLMQGSSSLRFRVCQKYECVVDFSYPLTVQLCYVPKCTLLSLAELSPLPPCSSTPPPRQYDDAEAGLAQIGDGMPPVIGVTHSKLCQLLGAAADSISESAVQNLLLPKIYVTPPSDDCDDSPTPECFSETASTITERVSRYQ